MRPAVCWRERAQVLPLTAVIMVALLGAVALVVDAGLLWITQRELQKPGAGAICYMDPRSDRLGTKSYECET